MHKQISRKLFGYFLVIVLVYSFASGILFMVWGRSSLRNAYQDQLLTRAEAIANSLTENSQIFSGQQQGQDGPPPQDGRGHKGRDWEKPGPNFIKWMNEAFETQIWLVDADKTVHVGQNQQEISSQGFSADQKGMIEKALTGEKTSSTAFSDLMGQASFSAAVPIYSQGKGQGKIVGALLMHEADSLQNAFWESSGKIMAVATLVGLALAALLAYLSSRQFVSPLLTLTNMTQTLAQGDYQVRSGIEQEDEIGILAANLDALTVRLDRARAESQALEQMRNDFISNMSHELKTPVTVLKSSVETLVSNKLEAGKSPQEYYQLLYEECQGLDDLIRDLLEYNTLQNDAFPLHMEKVDLVDVVQNACRSQRVLCLEKNLTLVNKVPDREILIQGDYSKLREMFITVLNNAVKYAFDGTQIDVGYVEDDEKIGFSIADVGPVIPAEEIPKVFTSFYRAENNSQTGFGLGLAIALEIAQRHHMSIDVSSRAEATVFTFYLAKSMLLSPHDAIDH